jgi:Ca2+-binding RTX toxin-like protein
MATIFGTDARDSLIGTSSADWIDSLGDNDRIWGRAGDDRIFGGKGHDGLRGEAGDDWIRGNDGIDYLSGGTGQDLLYGDKGNDVLDGGPHEDRIHAGSGDDTALGGTGNDLVHGDWGDDRLFGQEGDDILYGDAGDDRIEAGAGNDLALGGEGNDRLQGDAGDDRLFGDDGKDEIHGGRGANQVFGDAGNDTIVLDFTINLYGPDQNADEYRGSYADGGAGADTLRIEMGNNFVYAGFLGVNSATGTTGWGSPSDGDPSWEGSRFGNIERIEITAVSGYMPEFGYQGGDAPITVVSFSPVNFLNGGGASEHLIVAAGSSGSLFDGGGGNDTLVSPQNSRDEFIYHAGTERYDDYQGKDTIVGFSELDVIKFRGFASSDDVSVKETDGSTVFTWISGSVTVDMIGLSEGQDYLFVA